MLRFPTTLLSATATAVASFRFSTKCDGKIDRTKILVEPDVFGVFLTYKVAPSSNTHLGLPATLFDKAYAKEELKEVMKHHENSVICDAYITRGVSADSDLLLRIHSKDVVAAQRFAIDFQKSKLGRRLIVIESLTGVTKTLNYITKPASSSLNDSLFKTPYSNGPPVFGIVVPIKKSAQWWNLPADKRLALIEEHTRATLAYLPTVKRKLYHSTGLCDADFITYFETNDLKSFHGLMIALAGVEENTYHVRWGSPTIVSTIVSLEETIDYLMD